MIFSVRNGFRPLVGPSDAGVTVRCEDLAVMAVAQRVMQSADEPRAASRYRATRAASRTESERPSRVVPILRRCPACGGSGGSSSECAECCAS